MDNTWGSFVLGARFNSGKALHYALLNANINVDSVAQAAFESTQFRTGSISGKRHFELVTPRDLGFRNVVYHAEFYNRAESSGLSTLSAYKSALLRLHYTEQPAEEIVFPGMEPLRLKDGRLILFCFHAQSENSVWLRGTPVAYDSKWKDNEKFLFERK